MAPGVAHNVGSKALHPRSKDRDCRRMKIETGGQMVNFGKRRGKIGIPKPEEAGVDSPSRVHQSPPDRLGLTVVGVELEQERTLRNFSGDSTDHPTGIIRTAIVHETERDTRLCPSKTDELLCPQPPGLVVAGNDYAGFLHTARLDKPGSVMPRRPRIHDTLKSQINSVLNTCCSATPPRHSAICVERRAVVRSNLSFAACTSLGSSSDTKK